ncbi:MAG: hypothetical protein U9Q22_02040 [Candidatus Altiarchaeota archaeon]|nr:hypothetical protein [Candidatus Altiarchaeota archaeon]
MTTKLIEETVEKDSVSEDMMKEYNEIEGDTPSIKEVRAKFEARGEEKPEVPVEEVKEEKPEAPVEEAKEEARVEEVKEEKPEAPVEEAKEEAPVEEVKEEKPEVPVEEVKEEKPEAPVEEAKEEAPVEEEKMKEYLEIVKKQNKMVSNLSEGQRKGVKKLTVNDLAALDKLKEDYEKAKAKGDGETQKELGHELYEFGHKFKYWIWDV